MKNLLFINGAGLVFVFSMFFSGKQEEGKKEAATFAGASANCSDKKGIAKIICLSDAFKATLKDDQLALLQLPYSKKDAARWSNFPASFRGAKRVGLNFGAMTPTQMEAAKALLKEVSGTTSNEGWDEMQQLLNADDYLNSNDGGNDYGNANYYIALLGTPATTGTFEIQFGGHHLAFANTYTDGTLAGATPSFRGVEPFAPFISGSKSNQPMQQEQAALSAMLSGLSTNELAAAKLASTYSDIVAGPMRDGRFPSAASGIECNKLSKAEKKLILNAISTYVDDIDDKDAKTIMATYTRELDSTYIAYSGTASMTNRNDYVRIDGPSVWIEYSCQHGIILPDNHPHSVWRDKSKDYGGN